MERTDVVFDVVVEFVVGVFFVTTFVDMPRFKIKFLTKRFPSLIDGNHDLFSEIKIKKIQLVLNLIYRSVENKLQLTPT